MEETQLKPSVKVENVWMLFNLSREREERFKEYFLNLVRGKLRFDKFWALKGVSFELMPGDSLGIIGMNGAGKSTLLKVISGILTPTVGKAQTNGTIAPLIELSGGFDSNMSAKENIFFTGSMHGHSRKYLQERYQQILEYAELEQFADVPLRNFSSGMRSRLGFSIATQIEPDILIMDEVLAVGDAAFRDKSLKRTMEIIDGGATVLFVSHSMNQVKKVCKKVLWLERGRVRMYGSVEEVCKEYQKVIKSNPRRY